MVVLADGDAHLPLLAGRPVSFALGTTARIIDGAREGFRVWSGNDQDTLPLLAIGGYGVNGVDLDSLDLDPSWHVVRVPDAAIYDAGLRYEDLVKAVDVVVSSGGTMLREAGS